MNFWELRVGDTLWSAKITPEIELEFLEWAIWEIRNIPRKRILVLSPKTANGKFKEVILSSSDYPESCPKVDKPREFIARDTVMPGKDDYMARFHWDKAKLSRTMSEICRIRLKEIREEIKALKQDSRSYSNILIKLR